MIKLPFHQRDITLIQITDTHLLETAHNEFVGVLPDHHFIQILEEIQLKFPKIDAIFHTGDIAQDAYPDVYTRYLSAMQQLNVPFFQTLGNHDDLAYFPDNEPNCPSVEPSVIDLGVWQLIMLNTAVEGRIDGWMSDLQLNLLRQYLTQSQKPTLLAYHHHAFPMNCKWLDLHKLKNGEQFLDVIKDFSHVKACFIGHVHQSSYKRWQHIDFYSTPATSIQFKPQSDEFALDNTAPAFRSIILKADGTYSTELHYLAEFQQITIKCTGY